MSNPRKQPYISELDDIRERTEVLNDPGIAQEKLDQDDFDHPIEPARQNPETVRRGHQTEAP